MGINITQSQGVTVVFMNDYNVTINGKTYKKPSKGNRMSTIDGTVYINGYVFNNGKFKRSLLAIWFNYLS